MEEAVLLYHRKKDEARHPEKNMTAIRRDECGYLRVLQSIEDSGA
jgi:hypothetical protein